jgi:hypothetical protein
LEISDKLWANHCAGKFNHKAIKAPTKAPTSPQVVAFDGSATAVFFLLLTEKEGNEGFSNFINLE